MACNGNAFKEQYFGYQTPNTGFVDAYDQVGSILGKAVYTPTNPLDFDPHYGFVGAMYNLDVRGVAPIFQQGRYHGILPLDQQPELKPPWPYEMPVLL
jgi:hypothetical protein